ncbi:rab-GTPase-TBC domain-containing protein [Xylaria bambusicola]|uniref:rab-GTPase-TBC domain-containing protein n=1 Tax=Xylaria bambusicola TaxID=326684 RepID=UPI002008B7FC|nr:rab-GTPase-TBC domain-containing protein [Xylaria bambusicola]KAI0503188.1 rab-GTPase-TBC domain-containing protein [Xylaria bambusicola]
MENDQTAPLQRTTSQLSAVSSRSHRAHSSRAKSRSRRLASQASSSASSIATSDKSLTSFPSFSPQEPQDDPTLTRPASPAEMAAPTIARGFVPRLPDPATADAASIVESLTTAEVARTPRDALFEDQPVPKRNIPGALHLSEDEHIQRLLAKYGSVNLVRQIAEDLAHRDLEISSLRRKADARERTLRKIILECGLSNLDLEKRMRMIERGLDKPKRDDDDGLSNMMSDAMEDLLSRTTSDRFAGEIDTADSGETECTIRAIEPTTQKENKGTVRAWKDYFWGTGTSRKSSRAAKMDGEGARTAIRASLGGDRRPPIQEDLFTPPEVGSTQNSSRASSIYTGPGTRKTSTSLANMALQLVAGKSANRADSDSTRGRSDSVRQDGSLRTSSTASTKTRGSVPANPSHPGPKALMSMRRSTPTSVNAAQRSQNYERREGLGTSPDNATDARSDNYVPVEMDTIFSPEGQPPTLTHIYNVNAEYLTDRFGFIYDQRRKLRQREAAQVAAQIKGGSRAEMLTGGRSGISPSSVEDGTGSLRGSGSEDRPGSPNSTEDVVEQGRPKRWQDYLKIATVQTELLAHTPVATSSFEVLEGSDPPKSPGLITTNDRGFVPSASTTAALNNNSSTPQSEEASATLVHEDTEPVKLLLRQLSDVHDALQREKSVRWNEFLRKVRAERRRESEAAAAAASAAAEARFQKPPVMIPEAKLTDGETIGIADLGVKGKVGRAKWHEFRSLVLGGIPVANRPKVWAECSGALSIRIPGYYEDLVSRSDAEDDPSVITQIGMDVHRTLTDNIFFRRGPGVAKLREVLKAYARRNPEVGYCQGMNLITGNLLLIMPSTEDAFWVLVSIIELILPHGYYDHSLIASRADQVVLRHYVTAVLPKLSQHLEALSIELEALTFQWFLSVFTDCLSAEALFRVWDVVLCISDGSTFLFQVALALLKLNEQRLLQCDTPAAIYTYINHQMTNHAISIDGLIQASEGLRRVVRREEVEDRRNKAIEAEKQLMKEREEQAALLQRTHKSTSAPALVTETSASAISSPTLPSVIHLSGGENGSVANLADIEGMTDVDVDAGSTTTAPLP